MRVAHICRTSAGCNRHHRLMTTESRWAERGWPGAGKGHEGEGFSHAHPPHVPSRGPCHGRWAFPHASDTFVRRRRGAGSAALSGDIRPRQRTQRWTRHAYPELDPGALLHTARQAAMGLQERNELAFCLRIALDVALCHGQAGMAREFLHVPQTPPDLGDSARSPRNEGAAPRMRRTAIHLQ